jgi:hypothetical protein
VSTPVVLVAVPTPCPGALCVAMGPVSVVVAAPPSLHVRAGRPASAVRSGQMSRPLSRRERRAGTAGTGRHGHGSAGHGNEGHRQRDGDGQGGKASRGQQCVRSGEVALVARQARTPLEVLAAEGPGAGAPERSPVMPLVRSSGDHSDRTMNGTNAKRIRTRNPPKHQNEDAGRGTFAAAMVRTQPPSEGARPVGPGGAAAPAGAVGRVRQPRSRSDASGALRCRGVVAALAWTFPSLSQEGRAALSVLPLVG